MGIEKCLVTTVFSLLQLSLLMDSTVDRTGGICTSRVCITRLVYTDMKWFMLLFLLSYKLKGCYLSNTHFHACISSESVVHHISVTVQGLILRDTVKKQS